MGWWTVEWAAIHARRMESLCASSSCLLSLSLSQDHHQLEFPFIIIICALWTSWAPPLVLVHLLRLISTTAIKWTVSKWMVERQRWECPSVKTGEGIKDLRQEEQGKRKGGDNKAAAGFNWSEGTLGRQESSAHQRRADSYIVQWTQFRRRGSDDKRRTRTRILILSPTIPCRLMSQMCWRAVLLFTGVGCLAVAVMMEWVNYSNLTEPFRLIRTSAMWEIHLALIGNLKCPFIVIIHLQDNFFWSFISPTCSPKFGRSLITIALAPQLLFAYSISIILLRTTSAPKRDNFCQPLKTNERTNVSSYFSVAGTI